tara:strand:- start:943 stop:1158 length:216 start_codon:yes stop_codon:yes gene_type:complete
MLLKILDLGGYGQFIWPAFFFTFVSCFYLFKKTKRELEKQEKLYLRDIRQYKTIKIKVAKNKKITEKVLSS